MTTLCLRLLLLRLFGRWRKEDRNWREGLGAKQGRLRVIITSFLYLPLDISFSHAMKSRSNRAGRCKSIFVVYAAGYFRQSLCLH